MAYKLVQSNTASVTSGTLSITYNSTPILGNTLLCAVYGNGGASTVPITPAGWTLLGAITPAAAGTDAVFGKTATGSEHTISTGVPGATNMLGDIYEFSGVNLTGATAATVQVASNSLTVGTTLVATVTLNDLLFASWAGTGGIMVNRSFTNNSTSWGTQVNATNNQCSVYGNPLSTSSNDIVETHGSTVTKGMLVIVDIPAGNPTTPASSFFNCM